MYPHWKKQDVSPYEGPVRGFSDLPARVVPAPTPAWQEGALQELLEGLAGLTEEVRRFRKQVEKYLAPKEGRL